jgi:signal peptidase I
MQPTMMHDEFSDDQLNALQRKGYLYADHQVLEAWTGMPVTTCAPTNVPFAENLPQTRLPCLSNSKAVISPTEQENSLTGSNLATEGPAFLSQQVAGQLSESQAGVPSTHASVSLNEPGTAVLELGLTPHKTIAQDASLGEAPSSLPVFRPMWTVVPSPNTGYSLSDEAGVVTSTFTGALPAWKHWVREGLSIGRDVLLALVIALLIGLFVIQPVYVKGTSMLPRLREGERLFVNRFIYNFSKIERGDIVVFYYPKNPRESFIKRVIGLPGDEITLANGKLYINGQLVPEKYLSSDYTTIISPPRTWVVEPHHYFVMGDNRDASNDSRNWGFVPEMYIYGKAVYRYWPVSEMGFIEDEASVLEPLRRPQRMEDRQQLPPAE